MKTTRNTVARTEILKLIDEAQTALSHADLLQALGGLCDRVTVYRVLDRLTEEGRVHKVVNIDGVVQYATCSECVVHHHHHDHIHFSCEQCKSVTCLSEVIPAFKLPASYKVHSANFVVAGLCPNCSK